MQSSLQFVIPSGIAPALFSRAKGGASTPEMTPLLLTKPAEKGMPVVKESEDKGVGCRMDG